MLSHPDFTRVVEAILTTAGVPFERRELQDFVAAAWPLIVEETSPAEWAQRFVDRRKTVARAG